MPSSSPTLVKTTAKSGEKQLILGCMSGTSLDGIDLAIIETDGVDFIKTGKHFYKPYTPEERDEIARAFMKYAYDTDVHHAEDLVTRAHINAIDEFVKNENVHFDVIGFHGQTITHDPLKKFTWQIGKGEDLSNYFNVPVVYNFRNDDVQAGGQGAPLIPVYHRALVQNANIKRPVVLVNIGGVSNITYMDDDDLIAFDCGAGNALMDQVARCHFKIDFDKDGAIARTGVVDQNNLDALLSNAFFKTAPPKSLDRNPWDLRGVEQLSPVDQLATLMQFTVKGIVTGITALPKLPHAVFVTGGGRRNQFLMEELKQQLEKISSPIHVGSVDELGWDGDFMEAQGFAYMAARRLNKAPISFPKTTGVPHEMTGGVVVYPDKITKAVPKIYSASPESIAHVAKILRDGEICVLPTETVYGLCADASNNHAVAKIYETKSRPQFNPLIVHGASREALEKIALFDDRARSVAAQFWPGPLTLILPKQKNAPIADLVTAGLDTIAVRVPNHAVFRDVLNESGLYIAAPSANRSGEVSPTAPHHVITSLGELCPPIVAAGNCNVGLESTILDLSDDVPYILRYGAITAEDLEHVLGVKPQYHHVEHSGITEDKKSTTSSRIKSPGQLLKHYAPRIPVRLHAVDVERDEALLAFGSMKFMGIRSDETGRGGFAKDLPQDQYLNLSEAGDLTEAAVNLFAYLRALDRPEFKGIAVMDIPNHGIGLAINDRLSRAAQGR